MRDQIYRPGAGVSPPVMVGRDGLLGAWDAAHERVVKEGRVVPDVTLTGLRGTGKSVVLAEFAERARRAGAAVITLQGDDSTSLALALHNAAQREIAAGRSAWQKPLQRFREISISAFGAAVKLGIGPNQSAVPPVDAASMAALLADLAGGTRGGLILQVDELQMMDPSDMRTLGLALNQLNVAHRDARVLFVGAGLPNLPHRMVGNDPEHPAITNPERLFRLTRLPEALTEHEVAHALRQPARQRLSTWTDDAVTEVFAAAEGSPALVQLYAAQAWVEGSDSEPVTAAHVRAAAPRAKAEVANQYLHGRWERLPDRQREYLAALSLMGGRASSAQVAHLLGPDRANLPRTRASLIARGEIFEEGPNHAALVMPAMRAYALEQYGPARDAADVDMVAPSVMLERMAKWENAQRASKTTGDAFPPSLYQGDAPG